MPAAFAAEPYTLDIWWVGNADNPDALAPQYRYDNAMIYYNYGNFEEAEKRFNDIIEKNPASQHAASAAEIIIAEYDMRGDPPERSCPFW